MVEAPFPAIKSLVAIGLKQRGGLVALDFGDYWLESRWPLYQEFLDHAVRASVQYVDKISVVNNELRDRLRRPVDGSRVYERRGDILVLPNGVDLTLFNPDRTPAHELLHGSNDKTVIYAGAITRDHGCEALPWIVRTTCRLDSEIRFVFVGDGDYLGELQAALHEEEQEKRVLFAGRVPHELVGAYIAGAQVGIFLKPLSHASAGTYYPLKVLEYMAMRCPPVAEATSQLQDLILDGRNGRCVDLKSLPMTLVELLNSPDRRKIMGQRARERAMAYSWELLAKRMLDFWAG